MCIVKMLNFLPVIPYLYKTIASSMLTLQSFFSPDEKVVKRESIQSINGKGLVETFTKLDAHP